ncbi:hypothetical protein FA13DRAFT_1574047, partial [Coprinellus micaceus]
VLRDSTRADFILAFLLAHSLHEKYRVGTNGPSFKFWWTGCGPKKDGSITIDTDAEFSDAVKSILAKTGAKATVSVEFDTDGWVPFRVRKRVAGDDEDEQGPGVGDELLYGTKVPRVGDYDIKTQVNGHFIELIEKRWKCNEHGSENNGPGCCYRDALGNHWGLNMRKKKFYASALVRLLSDMTSSLPANQASAPSIPVPVTPRKPSSTINTPFSPIPPRSSELHACLVDFLSKEGVDLTHCESALAERRFIPSVLPKVPVARLIEVTGAVEGDAILLQSFCDTWCARLEEKK